MPTAIWSPGQTTSTCKSVSPPKSIESDPNDEPLPPVWTPKSAQSSPILERKEFKPVIFKSPILKRKVRVQSEVSNIEIFQGNIEIFAQYNEIKSINLENR